MDPVSLPARPNKEKSAGDDDPPEPSPSAASPLAAPPLLSPRQVECLRKIAAGESSAQIGATLGISSRTVDHYVGSACAKLGTRSRAQAVATAIRLDIIPIKDVT
jgi:DNA-binding CsgD family transcriptional regulator